MTIFCGPYHDFVDIDLVIVVTQSLDLCMTTVCSHVYSFLDLSGAELSS